MITLRWGSATDVGMVRDANQDSFLIAEPLFAVADGMGGHLGGEVASATALEVLKDSFTAPTRDDLLEAVRRSNAKVWDKGQLDANLHGMGTTLTAVARTNDDTEEDVLTVVHVGDSRGYLFRDGELSQITDDHSLVEEMVRAGELSEEEAESHPRRNIVTRALGVEPTVEADTVQIIPRAGDRILLCSDGLTGEIADNQIASILRRLKSPDEAARELVSQAKTHGGRDNITVVIVDVEDSESPVAINVPTKDYKAKKVRNPAIVSPTAGKLTFRLLLFFLAIVALIALACGSVVWYARSSYFVGLEGQQLVIYRGRPDPVLWFDKTVTERTNVMTNQVLPGELARLDVGVTEGSLSEARDYIKNLTTAANEARRIAGLPPITAAPPAAAVPAPAVTPKPGVTAAPPPAL